MPIKLKICGVTKEQDALDLVTLGVHAIGINFWEKSKRFISPQNATPFLNKIAGKISRVGVFVNQDIKTVKQIYHAGLIDIAQLHGNEDQNYLQELTNDGIEIIQVVKVTKDDQKIQTPTHKSQNILLDTHVKGYGGAGQAFDWNLAQAYIQNHPHQKIILAGGINLQNIQNAAKINPYMIDVASGAEISPGTKNLETTSKMLSTLNKIQI